MSNTITVSGVGIPDFAIPFPSSQIPFGQNGSNLYAVLANANATFGFNLTPNKLDMEFVPIPRNEPVYHGTSGQLPAIGTSLSMEIGDFYFKGRVIHSDYDSSDRGTIVRIGLEDDRKILEKIKIHTEDLGNRPPSGIVSVGRAYRVLHGLTDEDANIVDSLVFEYNKIQEQGATYVEIIEAIQLAIDENQISFDLNKIPSVEKIEANIGGSVEALRFKFNMTSLAEVISSVLQDSAYDWYWNMDSDFVSIVNKKIGFQIEENNLIALINEVSGFGDPSEGTQRLSFGQDASQEPTRFRLLGGRQQGFINSELLSPIDGLDTFVLDGNIVFTPAWGNISIGFYDADGFYRTYTPSDKELQMALAGIEQWAYFKIYQVSEFGIPADAGSIAAQHDTFQSRFDPLEILADLAGNDPENNIRIIDNRRDEEHNWVIDFFNRVNNHAQRHFGRSYVLSNVAFNEASGLFKPIDAAWCNLENQIDGQATGVSGSPGPFVEDYDIHTDFGPVSPFVTDDFRISAHVVLPTNTVYGPQGDQAPADFTHWTEDAPPFNPDGDGRHYVPCSIQIVGGRIINPRSSELYSFEDYPDGTLWVQLPIIAGTMQQDGVLANLATLIELSKQVDSAGLFDVVDPTMLIEPYNALSGVAIPIEARIRYGQNFPDPWVTGNEHYLRGEDVEVDDAFVPWNFFPIGNQTSLEIMTDRAVRKVQGRAVNQVFSRYADIQQVGLPTLTFDSFANQAVNASGLYGERTHGVTDFNISLGTEGYSTRYKIASYFAEFGREAPLGERLRAELDGILHPIDFTTFNLASPIPPPPGDPISSNVPGFMPPLVGEKKAGVKVVISQVNDIFTLDYSNNPSLGPEQERYRGLTETGNYLKPPSYTGSEDFTTGAICVDGFLNIGDSAIYHTDEFELPTGNTVLRYFTSGRKFGAGNVVLVKQQSSQNSSNYDVILEGGLSRAILNVPALNGSVRVNDRTTLIANNDASVKPGNAASGVYLQSSSAGAIPVQIISLDDAGTPDAFAYVRRINSDLEPDTGQALGSGIPFPFPSFAQIGDQGLLGTSSDGRDTIYLSRLPFRNLP